MNRMKALLFPDVLVLFDPDGDRHAEAGHAVEDIASDLRLGLLIGQSPGVKTPPMMVLYLYIAVSTRLRREYPELRCQPMRPCLAIVSRCMSRCVAAASLETAVDRGGMMIAAPG